jgi:hypothetical protein
LRASRAEDTNSNSSGAPETPRAAYDSPEKVTSAPDTLWPDGLGNGLRSRTSDLELAVGGALGLGSLVGHLNHDMALASISYGQVMGGAMGESHWYRGNWELVGEIFGGEQFHPRGAYLVGFTPLIRYSLATGTRWSPFLEGGFGPTATDIGHPDLSTTFEFNVQGTLGVHYFWNKHQAVTVQCRYLHLSNAGIRQPNEGVNSVVFLAGTSWFF